MQCNIRIMIIYLQNKKKNISQHSRYMEYKLFGTVSFLTMIFGVLKRVRKAVKFSILFQNR